MLPSLKTKSRDNNNRLYIEKQFTALLKKFTTSSGRTLRSFVPSFRMLLDSHNYKYSDVNFAQVLTPVRVRSKPSTCVQNRKDLKPKLVLQLKTQFRAFACVNTEANRSMLPCFKTMSTDNNNPMYIEQ